MTRQRELGKLHKWWLRQFRGKDAMAVDVMGYAGTPHGKALIGLLDRGLISSGFNFGSIQTIELTDDGKKIRDNLEP